MTKQGEPLQDPPGNEELVEALHKLAEEREKPIAPRPRQQSGDDGCLWWIAGIVLLGLILWVMNDSRKQRRSVPQQEYWHDAPTGQIRGGDSW